MQVSELSAEGLKREYKVVVEAGEIAEKVDARLRELAKTARIPGFRPGKVPVKLLKKQYGRSVMGEILEATVESHSKQILGDNNLRPALQPKIEVTSFDEGTDLEFKMDVEVLPEVPEVDAKGIALTRLVAEATDDQIERSMDNLAKSSRKFEELEGPRPAQAGDELSIDFVGTIDGEPFEGGKAEDFRLVLGDNFMIPGFEDQLVGAEAGGEKELDVTFPEDYPKEELRNKAAKFAVTVKAIKSPLDQEMDDEFAKGFGAESLDDLRGKLRERIEEDYKQTSRNRLKRELLDHLADTYKFEVPPGMVDLEFNSIWKQLEAEMEREGKGFDDSEQSEEEAREEYKQIAERRVRLGLILSDIGTKNDVKVNEDEMRQALMRQVQQFPSQQKEVFEFYRENPAALEQLRAPIFEEKVVDFMAELANVTEKSVSVEELMKDPDEEDAEDGEKKEANA